MSDKFYKVPAKYWHRIHFVRPRFKSNIENVLLYMANECCKIPRCTCQEYSDRFFNAIRMFPGNIGMADKTLHNWRTEIPALFGFYNEDKLNDVTETSNMAKFLHEKQDLTQFLRLFLISFQFPGGHMKPQDIRDIISLNIRFKPAQFILRVLLEGNSILAESDIEKEMSISAEEATYCIFNDVRVTSGMISPNEVARTILENRKQKLKYYDKEDKNIQSLVGEPRTKGDVTRYAGDILDYMEIANLLNVHFGYYSLKENQAQVIRTFVEDISFFTGYEAFYGRQNYETSELTAVESHWFEYVNSSMNPDMFKSDIQTILKPDDKIEVVFDDRIKEVVTSDNKTTKEIGNIGEALVCGHEKMRMKISGYDDFIRLIQIVDGPSYHPGFDIDSFEADGTEDHRYIEVKTTISKKKIQMYGFHMSTNEWRVAGTIKEHYCVYRLMLSEEAKILFVLRNPVALYKTDQIEAEPRDGMEISFTEEQFKPTELLIWKR
ncbi:MAG: DUF3883 domain-containing protein [Prevotella sp.]|nr:DUF3883 domain-containing protein [Prevotella sp.]